jgi:amino acid transporter
MSRDRLLPSGLAEISEETRSAYQSIIISAFIIAVMAVALPIESVASSSSIMFILLFSMVNVAAIAMRRKRPDLELPFEIPYMTTIPILSIVFQLLLAPFFLFEQGLEVGFGESSQGFIALVTMGLWFALSVVVYVGYSSEREAQKLEAETPTIVAERATETRESQLVVPIANPESVAQLMRTAIDIARERNAEIHVVSVVTVPPQTPLSEGRQYVDERR